MKNKYYLHIKVDEAMNASSKAVNDCNIILEKNGYKPFTLKLKKEANPLVKKVSNAIQFMKVLFIKKNSVLCIPHPLYINKKYLNFLEKSKIKNNLKLVFLIHDLDSVRKMFLDAQEDFEWMDNKMYSIADFIISHNDEMIKYLISQGVEESKLYNLEVFDYLADLKEKEITFSPAVTIAGNLDVNKCAYLKDLPKIDNGVTFDLYGVNFDASVFNKGTIVYHGAFPANEVPNKFTQGFGLVWDGVSIESCLGNSGQYLKYNNPHKLSLYLVSKLPVVIWSEAAEAKFVEENNVGFTVSSLYEIGEKLNTLSKDEYEKMKANASIISKRLREGYYLTKVIKEIEKSIK